MSLARSELLYTEAEYLALERDTEERHEYLDGHIYQMVGESEEHGTLCINLVAELRNQLRGTPCQVFSKDMKVRSGPAPRPGQPSKELYSYPDLVVVCGDRQYHDEYRDVLLNPAVIIEVLSPSTEAFDRGEKFRRYQTWNSTLTDYLLVSQSSPVIEHYVRQPDGGWSYYIYEGLKQSRLVSSIDCVLRLSEVYDRIVFPAPADEELDRLDS